MAVFKLSSKQKLIATIGISLAFFIAEIAIAFYTGSLALLADAFHYMNDLISFVVALAAILITEHAKSPQDFSFGWARAQLLGAFFNGVFLLALGVSIFLQSIERFISIQRVENPNLVLIMGCVGLTLNIISATILHEHHGHDHGSGHGHGHSHSHDHAHHTDGETPSSHSEELGHGHSHNDDVNIESAIPTSHSASSTHIDTSSVMMTPIGAHTEHRHTITKLQSPGRDLGMMGVLTHVIGDALNNIGVIIAALVIWLTSYDARFYADPGVSMGIALMILLSSLPLVKNSGKILMQSAPKGVDLDDVRHDLEKVSLLVLAFNFLLSINTFVALRGSVLYIRYRNISHPMFTHGAENSRLTNESSLADPRRRVHPRAAHLAAGPEEGDCIGTHRRL